VGRRPRRESSHQAFGPGRASHGVKFPPPGPEVLGIRVGDVAAWVEKSF